MLELSLLKPWSFPPQKIEGQKDSQNMKSGQIVFHQPRLDFPEIRGPISLPERYLWGEIGRVTSR